VRGEGKSLASSGAGAAAPAQGKHLLAPPPRGQRIPTALHRARWRLASDCEQLRVSFGHSGRNARANASSRSRGGASSDVVERAQCGLEETQEGGQCWPSEWGGRASVASRNPSPSAPGAALAERVERQSGRSEQGPPPSAAKRLAGQADRSRQDTARCTDVPRPRAAPAFARGVSRRTELCFFPSLASPPTRPRCWRPPRISHLRLTAAPHLCELGTGCLAKLARTYSSKAHLSYPQPSLAPCPLPLYACSLRREWSHPAHCRPRYRLARWLECAAV
jgi:hypothetical protein